MRALPRVVRVRDGREPGKRPTQHPNDPHTQRSDSELTCTAAHGRPGGRRHLDLRPRARRLRRRRRQRRRRPTRTSRSPSRSPRSTTSATPTSCSQEYRTSTRTSRSCTTRPPTSNDARDELLHTKLGAGTGLADIEAVEVDWLPESCSTPTSSSTWRPDDLEGRWLDWKAAAATDADGNLIGYGTDIGPEAICYRADLFEAAGLPTDRDEVAALLERRLGQLLRRRRAVHGRHAASRWFDSAGATYQGMVNQVENAYEEPDGTIIATDEPRRQGRLRRRCSTRSATALGAPRPVERRLDRRAWPTARSPRCSARGWMLGVIEGNAAGVTGWDIANVFPGGGGNWGGSYLTVPAQGKHVEAAQELADWLTAPEQQIKAFVNAGTFPSQVEALRRARDLLDVDERVLQQRPTGQILADRAEGRHGRAVQGPELLPVSTTRCRTALTARRVDGPQDADDVVGHSASLRSKRSS